ncbi:hypothetical protein D9M72_598090 [compost metagenome]
MVQLPALRKTSLPLPSIVQTPVVDEVNATANDESELAVSVGVVPKFCDPGLLKVMICGDAGVTGLLLADALPVPAELVAVTEKV